MLGPGQAASLSLLTVLGSPERPPAASCPLPYEDTAVDILSLQTAQGTPPTGPSDEFQKMESERRTVPKGFVWGQPEEQEVVVCKGL